MREICISLACWPGASLIEATQACLDEPLHEPLWGRLSARHVQIVPQTRTTLDEEWIEALVARYPDTQFRLHANVRLQAFGRIVDLSDYPQERAWFERAAQLSRLLRAPAYSAHSGRRAQASLAQIFDAARALSELFECPVAIEGQYPTRDGAWLIDSWEEYRALLESGVPYALDLSHIKILAHRSRRLEHSLLQDLLQSPQCIEVHVSDNDGLHDSHAMCALPAPWWIEFLPYANENAIIFSEGNQRAVCTAARRMLADRRGR